MTKKTNMQKRFYYYAIFVLFGSIVTIIFVTSTTYIQLAIASLLYPFLVYFVLKYLPKKSDEKAERVVVKIESEGKVKKEPVEIVDIDKRAFLKIIGAAGFSFFIFSLFTRRVEDLILNRNLAGLSGGKDTPPVKSTEGYRVTEISTEEYNYYGFINEDGNWYIMREDPIEGSFRYVKGDLNFSSGWARREKMKYDYFHSIF